MTATAPDNRTGQATAVDQGLAVLVMLLRYQGVGADPISCVIGLEMARSA